MELDEEKIKTLLLERKRYIKTSGDIIASGITLMSYIVTVALSNFLSMSSFTKILVSTGLLLNIGIFIYALIYSRYSIDTFYREIISCSKDHSFSLLVLKDVRGRFLLKYDKRWKTYLFPYARTQDDDKQAVRNFANTFLKLSSIEIKQIKEDDFTKTSVSANMTKTYHQKFYFCNFNAEQLPSKDCFKIFGVKYKWFSIDDMKNKKSLWQKNYETCEFVERNF